MSQQCIILAISDQNLMQLLNTLSLWPNS